MSGDLPKFQPDQFSQTVLDQFEIKDAQQLQPPEGLTTLAALLAVNQESRKIFEEQVGMPMSRWFGLAAEKFHLDQS